MSSRGHDTSPRYSRFLWYISTDPRLPATFQRAIRDPFDRVLIAQALQHDFTLPTMDEAVQAYSVPLLPTK